MTLQDKIENMQTELNFCSKIRMMLFLSYVSHSENYFDNESFHSYKKLLSKVSNKIDKWYEKRQEDQNCMNERFSRDEDYVELAESPSKFDSSDDDQSIEVQQKDGTDESKVQETETEVDLDYSKQNFLFGMSPQKGNNNKGADGKLR